MSRAVCIRCGASCQDFRQICHACGHRPDGEGLWVAWLLSSENLEEAALETTAKRIAAGEVIRPTSAMLAKAKRALGADLASDPGLSVGQRVALLATSLVLTPLVGWVLGIWWWRDRPRAAVQSLALSVPATLLFTVGMLWFAS